MRLLARLFVWFNAALILGGVSLGADEFQLEGRPYVDLSSLGTSVGMQSYWLQGEPKIYRLRSQWTVLDFELNSRRMTINGMPVYLGYSARSWQNQLAIAKADVRHVLEPIVTPQLFSPRPALRRIVLDAGHGGKDMGAEARAYGLAEKTLALDVTLRLKRLLESQGYTVILTRSGDEKIELRERSKRSNLAQADLFISIHFNAAPSTTAAGYETFALTPVGQRSTSAGTSRASDHEVFRGNAQDPWNMLAAYQIQRSLIRQLGGPDRGVKRARWAVLKDLECPGVLVELGFLSHAPTARSLREDATLERLALALQDGILSYRQRLARIR